MNNERSTVGKRRRSVANRICEFLVVITHAILYIHNVYPQRMFDMRQKYGIATFYSKQKDVNEYIANTVGGMHEWILQDDVESVAVVILDGDKIVVRYVFDISSMGMEENITMVSLGQLDNQLRAHVARILSTRIPVEEVAEDVQERRFEYVVYTKGVQTDGYWMAADGKERREVANVQGNDDDNANAVAMSMPLKDAGRDGEAVSVASRAEFLVRKGASNSGS